MPTRRGACLLLKKMWDLCFRATSLVVFIAMVSGRSQLDAFGFRKKSAYTPDDAHKVDAQMAKWVAEGKYSDTQGATGANSPLDPRKRWAHWPGSKINPNSDQGTPMRYGKKVYVEKTD